MIAGVVRHEAALEMSYQEIWAVLVPLVVRQGDRTGDRDGPGIDWAGSKHS